MKFVKAAHQAGVAIAYHRFDSDWLNAVCDRDDVCLYGRVCVSKCIVDALFSGIYNTFLESAITEIHSPSHHFYYSSPARCANLVS